MGQDGQERIPYVYNLNLVLENGEIWSAKMLRGGISSQGGGIHTT